jgi:hypothetical protein
VTAVGDAVQVVRRIRRGRRPAWALQWTPPCGWLGAGSAVATGIAAAVATGLGACRANAAPRSAGRPRLVTGAGRGQLTHRLPLQGRRCWPRPRP